ncbi:GH36-type glycosyl hydrolase domain-containing protein [Thalassotalea montiporae]
MMKASQPIYTVAADKPDVCLHSPTAMPDACGFLWNAQMMIQMNCRGYANAQHMQPEPAKYSKGPAIEATTFMQPEHHYYSDHPGRFFYIKIDNKPLLSLPYAPVNTTPESFKFIHRLDEIIWQIEHYGIRFTVTLTLGDKVVEHWSCDIENLTPAPINCVIYPMFSIGYMSWMNQSAYYDSSLKTIIATSITPYQHTQDFDKIRTFKDITFFTSEVEPDSWTCNKNRFIGNGHLVAPQAINADYLAQYAANYEVPIGVFQHNLCCQPQQSKTLRWRFGAVNAKEEIQALIDFNRTAVKNFKLSDTEGKNTSSSLNFAEHHKLTTDTNKSAAPLSIKSPDTLFDNFVNHWLPRQLSYHGQLHRLTTDPQTRNFLQDSMGNVYLAPTGAKSQFLKALSQQALSGAMPDGILLHSMATLKYINQVPHSDHNVWLIWFVEVYLSETDDTSLLNETVGFSNSSEVASVYQHLNLAMEYLLANIDKRGLSLIKQGDWCDPMNHVGKDGKGVSVWLSMATSRAFAKWSAICERQNDIANAKRWAEQADALNAAIEENFYQGSWYARGITDDGRTFGTINDTEGKIYLNTQSWAMLSLPLSNQRIDELINEVTKQLETPYGPMMLAPAYTAMVEDIGRLTQKSPGVAENGSVYNHAAMFYAAALYQQQKSELAFALLKRVIPSVKHAKQQGQLPVYLPNYYRGAYYQFPDMAGRSSHLFNTGTVAWFYHSLIKGMLGLDGRPEGLFVQPQLPKAWQFLSLSRIFRGHHYQLNYIRKPEVSSPYWQVSNDKQALTQPLPITDQVIAVVFS